MNKRMPYLALPVWVAAVFPLLGITTPAVAQLEVGTHIPIKIDTPQNYQGASHVGLAESAWVYVLSHPGATYIAIHFVDFDLGPGDYLTVSDKQGDHQYVMTGRGKMQAGTFWAQHIKGDTVSLELFVVSTTGGRGFLIDEYVAGDVPLCPERDICGADDKNNAICYATSHATEYDRGRAVARLLINGSSLCTGWLVSADDLLLTNEHCISSDADALNTDYEFMAEAPDCNDVNCQMCWPGTVFSGGTLVQDSGNLDYALVRVTSGNPAASYGFLEIDKRDALPGEQIYIPQHPGGRAKEFAITSSHPDDPDGLCTVQSITEPPCNGTGYNDVGYFADTEGGSSGSPVLARSSHQVIALHHCGSCPNRGVPIDLIYDEIAPFLTSGSPPILSNPRVEPTAGTESTVFEFLVDYYDPDGDPPDPNRQDIYITGELGGAMAFKPGTGTPSDGTYNYLTTLPCGDRVIYTCLFCDITGACDISPSMFGPYVCCEGEIPVTVHAEVDGGPLSTCMEFSASWDGGSIHESLDEDELHFCVPAGVEIYIYGGACCANYECDGADLYVNGSHEYSDNNCQFWFQLGPTAEYVDLYLHFTYGCELTYAISGTVLLDNGTPVPGGVDVTLDSPVQHEVQHTTDGSFSFAACGGVTVSVTFSADGYAFTPGGFTFPNHCDHETGLSVTAFSWDVLVPTTSFLTVPGAVSEYSLNNRARLGATVC